MRRKCGANLNPDLLEPGYRYPWKIFMRLLLPNWTVPEQPSGFRVGVAPQRRPDLPRPHVENPVPATWTLCAERSAVMYRAFKLVLRGVPGAIAVVARTSWGSGDGNAMWRMQKSCLICPDSRKLQVYTKKEMESR